MWTEIIIIYHVLFTVTSNDVMNLQDVNEERNELLKNEIDLSLGSDIILSDSEILANDIIKNLKDYELDMAFKHPDRFRMSKHFFDYKDEVKETELYKLIAEMPKGAALHVHDTGILSPDYMVNITYMNHLYVCFENKDVNFLFSNKLPPTACKTQWQLMRDARYASGDVEKFDESIRKHFTMVVANPNKVYTDINVVWKRFQRYFIETSPLLTYQPVWEQYFYDCLKAFREDNVMYVEIRSVLPPLYDLKGNIFDAVHTADTYKKVVDDFLDDYPDFFGAKLIYAPHRLVDEKTMKEYIGIAKEIKKRIPGFLAGFDMVGQEDLGMPIKDFLPQLVKARSDLDFFFHAGETNWYGSSSDENLVDAVVLNSKRIGHAFALVKHPLLIEEVKRRDIAIEANVISNCVLKLVADVRNHPLATFLAQNLPVVISSDDPGVWEADPLSHDFYVTFVGVASRHSDLKLLKKLALNSLIYNTYPNKDRLMYEFEFRWTKFIDNVVKGKWNNT